MDFRMNHLARTPSFPLSNRIFKGVINNESVKRSGGLEPIFTILKDNPPGSYIYLATHNQIYIKTKYDLIETIVPYASADASVSDDDLDYWVESNLGDSGLLYLKAKACKSILDVSFLLKTPLDNVKQALSSWTEKDLEGVEYIYFYPPDRLTYHVFGPLYAELLIAVARLNKSDIKIIFPDMNNCSEVPSDKFCYEVLDRMKKELKGEPYDWAVDLFLMFAFANTPNDYSTVEAPKEDTTWHSFYNNIKKGPTINVVLNHSKGNIYAHKSNLAAISPMLDKLFYEEWKEAKNEEFHFFDQYSDKVVTEFVRVAYGFKPDFAGGDLVEFIQFGDYMQSTKFLDHVYAHLISTVQKLDNDTLISLLLTGSSGFLPGKLVMQIGRKWGEIMDETADEDKKAIRETYLASWSQWLKKYQAEIEAKSHSMSYLSYKRFD
jgi:hypothetical protein